MATAMPTSISEPTIACRMPPWFERCGRADAGHVVGVEVQVVQGRPALDEV